MNHMGQEQEPQAGAALNVQLYDREREQGMGGGSEARSGQRPSQPLRSPSSPLGPLEHRSSIFLRDDSMVDHRLLSTE
jgi:hypothetical protein